MLWYNYRVNKARKEPEPLGLYESLFDHSVYYARAALEEKFRRPFSLEETYNLLKSEGMLPWEEYGVPSWYVDKWFPRSRSAAEDDAVG